MLSPKYINDALSMARIGIFIVAWVLCSACNKFATQKEIANMEQYISNIETHCVGRFLIAMPAQTKNLRLTAEWGGATLKLAPVQGNAALLDRYLSGKAAQLKSQFITDYSGKSEGVSYFGWLNAPAQNVRELRYYSKDGGDGFGTDGYVVIGEKIFLLGNVGSADAKKSQDFLLDLASKIRHRNYENVHAEAGFCFEGGLVQGWHESGERVEFGWSLQGHDDVRFGISMRTNQVKIDDGILDRENSITGEMKELFGSVKTLRKQRLQINGLKAQEWLTVAEEKNGSKSYDFLLEIPGNLKDALNPSITLEMSVGGDFGKGYQSASLTEGEAMILWDSVIKSLRLRTEKL